RQSHVRRDVAAPRCQETQRGSVARKTVRIVRKELEVALEGSPAAQRLDGRRVMVAHRVVEAAYDRQLIDDPSAARQMLTDPQPRDSGGHSSERAAYFGGRVGFHVPVMEVARTAIVKQEDA